MSTVEIVHADLTSMSLEAIVCPAHKHLTRGQDLSAQIFDLAGKSLVDACAAQAECNVGQARLTSGFNLPAKYIIHTVTPQWSGGDQWVAKTLQLLSQCYASVIDLAKEHNIRSLAFPALGAGSNKVPHPLAAHQALEVLNKEADNFDRLVVCLQSEIALAVWLETQQKFFPESCPLEV